MKIKDIQDNVQNAANGTINPAELTNRKKRRGGLVCKITPEKEGDFERVPQEIRMIPLEQICLSDKYRFRAAEDQPTIDKYSEIWRQYLDDVAKVPSTKHPFDPIHVLHENEEYIVIAGWHRVRSGTKAGAKEIPCIVLTEALPQDCG